MMSYASRYHSEPNIQTIFLDLIPPLAKKHRVANEDMIKRIFVFSDMQFKKSKQDKKKNGDEP